MLGNGFDLNLGLKTSYQDFYNYYLDVTPTDSVQEEKHVVINKFKEAIRSNISDWADLELALGKYTEKLKNPDDLHSIYYDLITQLTVYLRKEDELFNSKTFASSTPSRLIKEFLDPASFLRTAFKQNFSEFQRQFVSSVREYRTISFNYTSSFHKLLWRTMPSRANGAGQIVETLNNKKHIIYEPFHLHGNLTQGIFLGVDNIKQISNLDFRASVEVNERMLKPICNREEGFGQDNNCKKALKEANVVCIFGLSLGKTDYTWWSLLKAKLLRENCHLIIFWREEESPIPIMGEMGSLKRKILKRFLSEEEVDKVSDKVSICRNSDFFKLSIEEEVSRGLKLQNF